MGETPDLADADGERRRPCRSHVCELSGGKIIVRLIERYLDALDRWQCDDLDPIEFGLFGNGYLNAIQPAPALAASAGPLQVDGAIGQWHGAQMHRRKWP